MSVIIDLSMMCLGCGDCVRECPTGALGLEDDHAALLDPERCGECGCCADICSMGVLSL